MPQRKRARKQLQHQQPSASKLIRLDDKARTAHRDEDPHEELDRDSSSLTLRATSTVTQALASHPEVGRRGHEYRDNLAKGKARVHNGDVYNFHQPQAAVQENESGGVDVMEALAFEGMSNRLATVSPAYAETCKWMLDRPEYLDWRNPDLRHLHHGVLWIKGNAGTGKSTLMRCIHDHAIRQQHEETVVSFFFNARSPDALVKSTEGMYRCILHQVFTRLPRLKTSLPQIHCPKPKQQSWSLELLENALRNTVLALSKTESVTIYIDALDECKEDDVRQAVEIFEDVMESATVAAIPLLVCISSRYYPQITMRYHEELRLDREQEHMQDISQYVESKLTVSKATKGELLSEILRRSDGVFLWVVLVVRRLRESSDAGCARAALYAILDAVPQELDTLFAAMMEGADSALTTAVQFVLFSLQDLDARELYHAAKTRQCQVDSKPWDPDEEIDVEGTEKYIVHISRGLIEFVASSQSRRIARFIHETVREHLLSHGLAGLDCRLQGRLEAVSHRDIAEVCLTYLNVTVAPLAPSDLSCKRLRRLLHRRYLEKYSTSHTLEHMELAFKDEAIDLTSLEKFPVEAVILIQVGLERWYLTPQPEHSSALLYVLVDWECESLAEALLMSKMSDSGPRLPKPPCENKLTAPDLRSTCQPQVGSPLHLALVKRMHHLVVLMLEYGADVNLKGPTHDTPMNAAVGSGSLEMVQLLYENGAYINPLDPSSSLLHQAAYVGSERILRFLLQNGADASARDSRSCSALHLLYNTFSGSSYRLTFDVATVQILLDAGVDLDATDENGDTPLMTASSHWNYSYVRFLLERNASVHVKNNSLETAVHMAVGRYRLSRSTDEQVDRAISTLQQLLDSGADVDARDGDSITPLISASDALRHESVKTLLNHGANVHARDKYFRTAVHMIAESDVRLFEGDDDRDDQQTISTLEQLLDAGADINAAGGEYGTALIAASAIGKHKLVKALLDHGASSEYRSAKFGNALEAARARGHDAVVELLLNGTPHVARIQAEDESSEAELD